jgi:hypothetical protein
VLAVGRILVPALDAWVEGRDLWVGAAVAAAVLVAFGASMRMARRRAALASR